MEKFYGFSIVYRWVEVALDFWDDVWARKWEHVVGQADKWK
jgi:hypothetical protein